MKKSIRFFLLTTIAAFSMVIGSAINNTSSAYMCEDKGCIDVECSPDDRMCLERCAIITGLNCNGCAQTTQC